MEQCVPKRRHITFRRQGVTQKKEYNIQKTAKVSNQECSVFLPVFTVNARIVKKLNSFVSVKAITLSLTKWNEEDGILRLIVRL
jgi:hypothetical protein